MNLRFECTDGRYDVDITLADRMTIIADNSGTGKTFLGRYLEKANSIEAIKWSVKGYHFAYVNKYADLMSILNQGGKYVIFVDELEQWRKVERYDSMEKIRNAYYNDNSELYFIIPYKSDLYIADCTTSWYVLRFKDNTFNLVE